VSVGEDGAVDCHPLLREYFAMRLRAESTPMPSAPGTPGCSTTCAPARSPGPTRWPGCNRSTRPSPTAASPGGSRRRWKRSIATASCAAPGRDGFYSWKLGAIGADLGAVAAFFDEPWTRLSPNLSEPDQAWLLNEAALYPARPRTPHRSRRADAGGAELAKTEGLEERRQGASNLSELEVTLGQLREAVADGRRAIEFADRSGDAFQKMAFRAPSPPTRCIRPGSGRRPGPCSPRRSGCRRSGSRSSRCSTPCRASAMPICSWPPPSAPRGGDFGAVA
jgi:hypothetical protein